MASPLKKYLNAFSHLRVNTQNPNRAGCHKPCMLLAVMDAIEANEIQDNRIRYEPRLLEHYDQYFDIVLPNHYNRRAYYPFYYLKSDEFWNLNYQSKVQPQTITPTARNISKEINFVSLNEDLYACLLDSQKRNQLREVLIRKWFPAFQLEIWEIIRNKGMMRHNQPNLDSDQSQLYRFRKESKRSTKFRIAVLKAYNYQCAATKWKLKVNRNTTLLEAAHIMPLEENQDNRPQNGIALSPTIHKAMDSHLIAPGPDYRWHASKILPRRAKSDGGARWLLQFDGADVLPPTEEYLKPCKSALEWRMDNLL